MDSYLRVFYQETCDILSEAGQEEIPYETFKQDYLSDNPDLLSTVNHYRNIILEESYKEITRYIKQEYGAWPLEVVYRNSVLLRPTDFNFLSRAKEELDDEFSQNKEEDKAPQLVAAETEAHRLRTQGITREN